MDVNTSIWVTTQKVGYHKWEKAPTAVYFLRHIHRHIFHIKVWIEILDHNDREIEFFLFKKFIDNKIQLVWQNTGLGTPTSNAQLSCEMICDEIYAHIGKAYPTRDVTIEVSEDKENGAVKMYLKKKS